VPNVVDDLVGHEDLHKCAGAWRRLRILADGLANQPHEIGAGDLHDLMSDVLAGMTPVEKDALIVLLATGRISDAGQLINPGPLR